MNRNVLTALVLILLIGFLISPFSALALLMGVLLLSAIAWTVWTLAQVLVTGHSPDSSKGESRG